PIVAAAPLSLHDALPICHREQGLPIRCPTPNRYLPDAAQEPAEHTDEQLLFDKERRPPRQHSEDQLRLDQRTVVGHEHDGTGTRDRKSTRLNSSHVKISY